ncbi:F-box/kelch-repeat protein At3g23880-like [Vicia villosa]|uniref:F-box/kelch-repeat protein At3g23880-like n=1 Tax=Vicia villosa TaxID=3911 RepID=UPI00273BE65A|nr:F-box/kelch-repeat protein At3g23880-like [Vicia villosa]
MMNPSEGKSQKFNHKLMNPCEGKSRKSNGSVEFLPEELITEVLSYLPVKSLMQLRCVCKTWNTLISHPKFIKQHLQQSKKKTQILCMFRDFSILPFPLDTLLNNPSIIKSTKYYFPSNPDYHYRFVGSCNGLFCFFLTELSKPNTCFQLWNPATNTLSNKFGHRISKYDPDIDISLFSFGYDNSTDTYNTVCFHQDQFEIFSSRSNFRKIIPVLGMSLSPLIHSDPIPYKHKFFSDAVYLNGTINLLARTRVIAIKIVIISLNLGTYTYSTFLPPQDFVAARHLPTIHVMEGSLYFSHYIQKSHFIIWKMTEFGNENSWTQFLKISPMDLNIHMEHKYFLAPLCLYESGIALVLRGEDVRLQVTVYNWSENRIKKTRMLMRTKWMFNQNYVESLVPTSCVSSSESSLVSES